jgi:hypothetical protein
MPNGRRNSEPWLCQGACRQLRAIGRSLSRRSRRRVLAPTPVPVLLGAHRSVRGGVRLGVFLACCGAARSRGRRHRVCIVVGGDDVGGEAAAVADRQADALRPVANVGRRGCRHVIQCEGCARRPEKSPSVRGFVFVPGFRRTLAMRRPESRMGTSAASRRANDQRDVDLIPDGDQLPGTGSLLIESRPGARRSR